MAHRLGTGENSCTTTLVNKVFLVDGWGLTSSLNTKCFTFRIWCIEEQRKEMLSIVYSCYCLASSVHVCVCMCVWIYCPGHAGVSGNERADRLASTADITSGLQLGRAEVLRGLRNFLNTDKPEHHRIDRLKERGVEKGSGRHSTLQGREQSVFNQTNIGTVSRATLGRLLRDGAERVWAFPSATMPS